MIPFDSTEAMKSGVYCSGTTGVGKSDVAMYVAEQLMKEGIIVVVFDPTQDWQTRSSIPKIYKPTTLCANWNKESIIFDMSQMTITDQLIFVETFCKNLIETYADPNYSRKPTFLIFEEAHTYFPEGCMRAKVYRNAVRMMTQGRNFGIRFACISQFASLIDKNAMRYMRQRYIGYTDEPNDVEYVKRFFPKKSREDLEVTLGTLQAGDFIYKNGNETELVQIQPYKCDTKPQLIATSNPSPAPPNVISESHSKGGGTAITTLIIAFLWFMAIIYAISHR